ncbi:hypothetical protein Ahy_B09g096443 [Arachis hypogaea]|uniref:Uncharacterized protein n=1 Tax=Arachis hypogaea TaxID=3818 RepID=A0A444XKT6_ARAHY|nr:hypothetical protein Ahy_B09g096443 [Arachis hypogaea]
MIHFKNARSQCYISLFESEVVKIAIMGLGFYMRQKLFNVHIPDLAHLAETIFDVLLKDKQLILPVCKTLPLTKYLKGKLYCKLHQATSDSTNNCVCFRDLIQEAIMEKRLKFDDGKKYMKVDSVPFDAGTNFAEPFLGVNMVGFSYEFDTALGDFETNIQAVYPSVGEGLLEFLMQQKLKDRDVSFCP